jgi:hypothetical protein
VTKYTLRPIEAADQPVVTQLLTKSWGSTSIVVGHSDKRPRVHDAATLPGLIASQDGEVVGLLTFFRRRKDRPTGHHQRVPKRLLL